MPQPQSDMVMLCQSRMSTPLHSPSHARVRAVHANPPQGIVTQVTDVKPLASVITYTDEDGGTELYQEVLGR